MKEKFNKLAYDKDYHKKHKKRICLDLNIDEAHELDELCEKKKVTKIKVFRQGLEWLRKLK